MITQFNHRPATAGVRDLMEKFGVNPIVALALSMSSKPGTYSVLLGSGVSRSAGIPTGWEVTLDLVRKTAKAEGEDASNDPLKWYRGRFGGDPAYSEVINELAGSQTERRNLLKGYFEPTEAERNDGKKIPTEAHEIIARLAARGYLSVILTTNFDRLMERALEAKGITPNVIATPDAIKGVEPLQHAGVTVVKVNGDYLDTRIKNTPEELEEYESETEELLDKIFDEYGLIICGWSGTSDTALKDALQRVRSRRYTAYWVSRGEPAEGAKQLATFLGAVIVQSEGADRFFGTLEEKVLALESLQEGDPLSPRMAVATVKRYLEEDRYRIRLRDFLVEQASSLGESLFSREGFPLDRRGDNEELSLWVQRRLRSYDVLCETAVGALITGGYWAREVQAESFAELLRAAARPPGTEGSLFGPWRDLELYPALRLLYAGGIASAVAQNWEMIKVLTREVEVLNLSDYQLRPAGYALQADWLAEHLEGDNRTSLIYPNRRYPMPLNQYLYDTLREPLREYTSTEAAYKEAFDRFEILLSLVSMNLDPYAESHGPEAATSSRCRFMYERLSVGPTTTYERMRGESEELGMRWGPVASGILKADEDALEVYWRKLDELVEHPPRR